MIKALIFDIDNTLYSYDRGHEPAWEALCGYALTELSMDRETFSREIQAASRVVAEHLGTPQAALHNRALRFQVMLERNKLPLSHAASMNRLYWDTLIAASRPEPGVPETLETLKAAGCILGIGSDMTLEIQLEKLEKLGLLHFFDFIVTSEEAGAEKPDPKLFRLCAEKAGVRPEECLFLGDSYQKDYLGPRAIGMQSLWYQPDDAAAEAHPDAPRLSRHAELPARLGLG